MDKKYTPESAEQHNQQTWEQNLTYVHTKHAGPLFSIDTPPPTVSGSLHIGHIFSYTQTDIIARFTRMNGYAVFYPFGFDDNGLPTEKYVEKKCKVRAHQLGRSEFIKLCLQETHTAEQEFKQLWQKMGLSVDWNYWYSTISESTRRISQLSFLRLYKDGFIYKKNEPALYCPTCNTTVAQAELEDAEMPSTFNDIIFKDEDGNNLVVATTRPELLYSTSALLYHPSDTRYYHLRNKKAYVPIFNTEIPIYEDEGADPQKGTGLVMVSTFGDQKDIEWFKKFNLPLRISFDMYGKWKEETGPLAGLKVADARKKIVELLEQNGLLVSQKPITHAVNVHERCKNGIEYIVLSQWFIRIIEHKDTFIKLADTIEWYPAFMKTRYIDWVSNIKWDWCISRQRFFGIPFPVWHCVACSAILLPDEKSLPIDPQEKPYPALCLCGSSDIKPDTDVMDTWNTSSLTPYITYNLLHPDKDPFSKEALDYLPMGMRPQAHDIIRTWAFYTIIKTWMHNKTIPWKKIVISGHVTFNKEKISKSQGNNPYSPDNLLKQYSADVIRYWTASGSLGHDTSFSDTQLKIGQRLVTKLWNAFNFAQPHLETFKPTIKPAQLGALNEWIITSASKTFASYQDYFGKNEFGLALDKVERFFWHDFCDNYIELVKHQLFNPDQYTAQEIQATQWTLYTVGLRILQMYAPYVPFVTESIYKEMYAQALNMPSLHQTKFASIQTEHDYTESYELMQGMIEVITQVRKLKSEHQLSLKTAIATLTICSPHNKAFASHEQLIKGITQAEKIAYISNSTEASALKKDGDHVDMIVVCNETQQK